MTIEWRPLCEDCAGDRPLLPLGPNPAPCRVCGETCDTAWRVEW